MDWGSRMTNKEAIVHIEEIRPKKCKMVNGKLQGGFPDHDSDTGKAIDAAIKALEKADKYRWHDLRKNPNDLPEADEYGCSEYVLVMIGTPEWSDYEWAYYNHNTMMWSTYEQNVFAWRYIEPFEENKDDE